MGNNRTHPKMAKVGRIAMIANQNLFRLSIPRSSAVWFWRLRQNRV
jgi:hypothetical protein